MSRSFCSHKKSPLDEPSLLELPPRLAQSQKLRRQFVIAMGTGNWRHSFKGRPLRGDRLLSQRVTSLALYAGPQVVTGILGSRTHTPIMRSAS